MFEVQLCSSIKSRLKNVLVYRILGMASMHLNVLIESQSHRCNRDVPSYVFKIVFF